MGVGVGRAHTWDGVDTSVGVWGCLRVHTHYGALTVSKTAVSTLHLEPHSCRGPPGALGAVLSHGGTAVATTAPLRSQPAQQQAPSPGVPQHL